MKKLFPKMIFRLLAFSFLFSLAGCSSRLQLAREITQEVINAFIAEDEEALHSILARKTKDDLQTRQQIQAAFDFIEGEITSYELPDKFPAFAYVTGGGKTRENGEITFESMEPIIKNIETDSGGKYQIMVQYIFINEANKDSEGIRFISVRLLDEKGGVIESSKIGPDLSV